MPFIQLLKADIDLYHSIVRLSYPNDYNFSRHFNKISYPYPLSLIISAPFQENYGNFIKVAIGIDF